MRRNSPPDGRAGSANEGWGGAPGHDAGVPERRPA